MLPIVAGVATAVAWAISVLASARASRVTGAPQTVAGVMVVGTVLILPVALVATPLPPALADPVGTVFLAALAGAANVGGLLLTYAAYRVGAVGIIATIGSTEGAIAAAISVLAGQTLAPGSGFVLALVAVGVALAAASGGGEREDDVVIGRARSLRAAGLATCAAGLFGLGLFMTGHVAGTLPPAWVILPSRVVGVVAVAAPLFLAGRFRVVRSVLPLVLLTGLLRRRPGRHRDDLRPRLDVRADRRYRGLRPVPGASCPASGPRDRARRHRDRDARPAGRNLGHAGGCQWSWSTTRIRRCTSRS